MPLDARPGPSVKQVQQAQALRREVATVHMRMPAQGPACAHPVGPGGATAQATALALQDPDGGSLANGADGPAILLK